MPERTVPRLDARTARVLGVGAASYLGRLGGALALLINVPLARDMLDAERFGVWMMLSALLGFFVFADLGIGYAVQNRITAVLAGDPARRRDKLAREIVAGYACTSALGLCLFLVWVAWWAQAADPSALAGVVSAAHRGDVIAGLATFATLFALNLPAALIQKIQLGAQDGLWVGVAQFVASLVTLAALPAVLHLGGGLAALVVATLGVQVLVNVGSALWWLRRQDCLSAMRLRLSDRQVLASLLRSGGLFFALQLAGAFAFQSDAIVISQTLGPAVYGEFAVVQRPFLLIGAGLSALVAGLWPAFADAFARGDLRWARQALFRAWWLVGSVTLLCVLVLVLNMETVAVRWLQAAVVPPLALSASLAAWTLVEALGTVSGACMNGAHVLRLQLIFALVMAGLAFAGKWWAVGVLGLPGPVLATLLAYMLVAVPGQLFIFRRLFAPLAGKA
jgi:O-antigen/teichoic acid export membrane protein